MVQRIEVRVPFQGFYQSIHDDAIDHAIEMHDEQTGENLAETFSLTAEKVRQYVSAYLTRLSGRLPCADDFTDMRVKSPKEYNFETDSIIATLHVNTLRTMMAEVKRLDAEGFRQRVKEELAPRSGFVPFYSNDLNDWPQDQLDWDAAQLELLIRFYLEAEHGDDWEQAIVEEMSGNGECDDILG